MTNLRELILLLSLSYAALGAAALNAAEVAHRSHLHESASLRFFNEQVINGDNVPKFTEGYVKAGDQLLHYVTGGSGKLVVFYHGFPAYWYLWKHQLKALSKKYRVVAFDGLGANLSDKPSDPSAYRISNLASQLQSAIHALTEQEPYILIGHDWGGALAWAYAQENPPGLEKLIVLNAPPYNLLLELLNSNPDQIEASQYMERLKSKDGEKRLSADGAIGLWRAGGYEKFVARGYLSQAEGQLFKAALARPGVVTGGINWYRANVPAPGKITEKHYWPSKYKSTSVNSLLIWGETDKTFVPEVLQLLPNFTEQLKIEILPGIGHTPQLEAPERVNQLIQEFIESK